MPNKASAKKRLRQTVKKTTENKNRKTRIKTFVKKVEQAIVQGDQTTANEALSAAQSEIMEGRRQRELFTRIQPVEKYQD